MSLRFPSLLGLCVALLAVGSQAKTLRVCADPDNLPMSNQAGQGFENRLAEFVAAKLGNTLEYVWWVQRKSFIEHSLAEGKCDVLMGVPSAMGEIDVDCALLSFELRICDTERSGTAPYVAL